jgi:glycosyltransferase involved in cell wall biosynthesis
VSARMTSSGLHVLMTLDAVGGVWPYGLDLARGLGRQGVRTTLAVLGPSPRADQVAAMKAIPGARLIETGLPLDWTASRPDEIETAGSLVAGLAREHRADLVHLNSPALAAFAKLPAPAIAVCHSCLATWWDAMRTGPLPADFAWRTGLTARGYRNVDALIAPTAAFAEATARLYGLAAPPMVVRNGRSSQPGSAEPQHPPFAFTAGRLWDEGKNLAAVDRAAARLSIPLLAAGPTQGPNGASIELKHVRPLGQLPEREVRNELAAQPIFVSVPYYEPFGLAVLEAAQAGCALVLSEIPTLRELWDGAAAFVRPQDEEEIAAAVNRLARDPEHRASRGAAAQRRAQLYTVEAMTAETLAVYRSVLKRRAPGFEEAAA